MELADLFRSTFQEALLACLSSLEYFFIADPSKIRSSFSWIATELAKLVQNLQAKTLEHLSVVLCNWLLASCDSSIEKVKVQIDKPEAIKEATSATVITKRSRSSPSSTSASSSVVSSSSVSSHPPQKVISLDVHKTLLKAEGRTIFDLCGLDFCGPPRLQLPTKSTKPVTDVLDLCFIAIGTNLGQRARNICEAIDKISEISNVRRISFLYETPAAYVTDQPAFLNCAIAVDTSLSAQEMLTQLKRIEEEMGRKPSFRFGPRLIDLDIIAMGQTTVDLPDLIVPHTSMHERAFVLVPLLDICPSKWVHPKRGITLSDMVEKLPNKDILDVRRVVPVPMKDGTETCMLVDERAPTRLFGVLNVTPDSFSDGGQYVDPNVAKKAALEMMSADATVIVDIGGESTKPDSAPVSVDEELSRVGPVISTISDYLKQEKLQGRRLMSIDTNKVEIARKACELGCNILNDVYATSRFYSDRKAQGDMIELVKEAKVPWIMMHCRGKAETMNQCSQFDEGRVVEQIAEEMLPAIKDAISGGVMPWQIVVDPGVGFSKRGEQNVEICRHLSEFKSLVGGFPLLVGVSRKRFLGSILGREKEDPKTRDDAGNALVPLFIDSGVSFIRVHNVASTRDVVTVHEHIVKKSQ